MLRKELNRNSCLVYPYSTPSLVNHLGSTFKILIQAANYCRSIYRKTVYNSMIFLFFFKNYLYILQTSRYPLPGPPSNSSSLHSSSISKRMSLPNSYLTRPLHSLASSPSRDRCFFCQRGQARQSSAVYM